MFIYSRAGDTRLSIVPCARLCDGDKISVGRYGHYCPHFTTRGSEWGQQPLRSHNQQKAEPGFHLRLPPRCSLAPRPICSGQEASCDLMDFNNEGIYDLT